MDWLLRKICERLNKRFMNGRVLFSVFIPVGYVVIGTGEHAVDTWIKNAKDLEIKDSAVQPATNGSTPLCDVFDCKIEYPHQHKTAGGNFNGVHA